MALHHRPNLRNIRSAYSGSDKSDRSDTDGDESLHREQCFSGSERSYQTARMEYSSSPAKRPPQVHYNTYNDYRQDGPVQFFPDRTQQESPRSSTETYASTIQSEEELLEELPEYDVPDYTAQSYESTAIPATPSDFSDLFPSHRRLAVRHDDSTLDGNMNLRIDTEVIAHGRRCDMTLFHLRMHDLKYREFSLRRYCRDSGREVCHTTSKQQKPSPHKRPNFQRSLSNAINSMRTKSESRTATLADLKRNDSGYGSMHSVDFDKNERPHTADDDVKPQAPPLTDTVKLEFSNYAQLDVKCAGGKGNRRYEFEYWGPSYAWKRIVRKDGALKKVSFHLTKAGSDQVLAYTMPASLTSSELREEQDKGGWIPPCSMWIADESIVHGQKDVADVVIASGLIALVDDSIRARFHSKNSRQLLIPLAKSQMGVEYVGPKRLINEMFRRDSNSSQSSRPSSSSGRPSTSGHRTTSSRIPAGPVRHSSYDR